MRSEDRMTVPETENARDRLKYEVARELGVDLNRGYNGRLTAREAGKVGGGMVRRMIREYEQNHPTDSDSVE